MENKLKNIDDFFKEQADNSPADTGSIHEHWKQMSALLAPAVTPGTGTSTTGSSSTLYLPVLAAAIIGTVLLFALKSTAPPLDPQQKNINNNTTVTDTIIKKKQHKKATAAPHDTIPKKPKRHIHRGFIPDNTLTRFSDTLAAPYPAPVKKNKSIKTAPDKTDSLPIKHKTAIPAKGDSLPRKHKTSLSPQGDTLQRKHKSPPLRQYSPGVVIYSKRLAGYHSGIMVI